MSCRLCKVFKEEAIGNAFIGGIISNKIKYHLLKNSNFTHLATFEKSCFLKIAQKNSEIYRFASVTAVIIVKVQSSAKDNNFENLHGIDNSITIVTVVILLKRFAFFCVYNFIKNSAIFIFLELKQQKVHIMQIMQCYAFH